MLHRRAAHCLLTAGLPVCFRLTGRHTGLPLQRATARLLVACHSSADGLPVCFQVTGRHTGLPLQRVTARMLAPRLLTAGLPVCFQVTGRHTGLPLQRVTACLLVTYHSSACDSSAREPCGSLMFSACRSAVCSIRPWRAARRACRAPRCAPRALRRFRRPT